MKRWALAVFAAANLVASPAYAWGPLVHGIVAQRAFTQLVPKLPWLTPQRDAFAWGGVCADLHEGPGAGLGRERTHGAYTVTGLWQEARRGKDRGAQAFALGWACHVAADEVGDSYMKATAEPWLAQLPAEGAGKPPASLVAWAVDAACVPKADDVQWELAIATRRLVGTPAGAPIEALLDRVLDVDADTYTAWAGLVGLTCAGDADHYLALRARLLRLGRWTAPAREASARQALGDLTPWLTRSVRAAVDRVRGLALEVP